MTEQKTGTMQIYRDILLLNNFTADGKEIYEYVYDGKPHSVMSVNCDQKILNEMGIRIQLVSATALTNVGEIPASYEVIVIDEYGNDVSDEYRIEKEYAKLRIIPKQIEITIKDAKKVHNGTPITASAYTISNGSLASGHRITSIIFSGSQTDIGCSESTLASIVISDAQGNQVQDNYAISHIPGELRVTP